jgi:hypothetical protein
MIANAENWRRNGGLDRVLERREADFNINLRMAAARK